MPRRVKEMEDGPPANAMPWLATPNGRYYDHEKTVEDERVVERRKAGIVVYAQTAYSALQLACRELRLATEHIDLKQQEAEPREKSVASNYLQFSEVLVLKSPEEKSWFERYLKASRSDSEGWDKDAKPLSEEAKFWDGVLGGDECACFEYSFGDEELDICFFAGESGTPDHVAQLVQHFFKEMRPEGRDGFALSWAETCSKMRPGEFGGGGVFITKDKVHYLSVWQWIDEMAQQLNVE